MNYTFRFVMVTIFIATTSLHGVHRVKPEDFLRHYCPSGGDYKESFYYQPSKKAHSPRHPQHEESKQDDRSVSRRTSMKARLDNGLALLKQLWCCKIRQV